MADPHSRGPVPLDPLPVRILKRTLLVLLGPAQFLFVAFAPLICSGRRGFRGWYWRAVKRACSRLLGLLSIRVRITPEDRQALVSDTDSVIVINHRSHLDGFTLMDAIPDAKWFTFAAKREFFDMALLRTGFTAAGLVPIDRASGRIAMETLGLAVRDMPARRSVVLFPEGTRTSGETLGPFKPGAVLVARASARTIRPIVLHGSGALMPLDRRIPTSGTLHVEVLEPFHVDPDASIDDEVARLHAVMSAAYARGPLG